MHILTRLTKLEALAPEPAATGGLTDYLLGVAGAVYEAVDEADQARRIEALGPQPEPVNATENAMVMQLSKAYGGTA